MDRRGYKKLQDAWHSGNTGSDPREIFITLSSAALSVFLGSVNSTTNSFLRHFILLVIPLILSLTDAAITMHMLPTILVACSLVLLFKDRRINFRLLRQTLASLPPLRPPWITNFKALTFLSTAICICAVDFTIFPRKFAKTETFGLSVMDLGVGFYIVSSGLVAKRENLRRALIGVLVLSALGAFRALTLKSVDYYEHVTEYGVHWNFFFTLAACRAIHTVLSRILPFGTYWLALPLPFYHQAALQYGLQDWVLGKAPRVTLINANREGIASLPGYLALFYLAEALSEIMMNSRSHGRLLLKMVLVCIASWIFAYSCSDVTGVSRRLCNLGYVLWVMAMSVTLLVELIVIAILLDCTESAWLVSPLLTSISRNGLLFFIIANLLTGMVNINIPTLLLSAPLSYAVVITYSAVICYFCHSLHKNDVTIKFW